MESVFKLRLMILLGTILFLWCSGCADDLDPSVNQVPFIDEDHAEITFLGDERSEVIFPHKVHSERLANNCFQCHFCGDLSGKTHWMCRDCHGPLDPELLCQNDDDHGCTYTQCQHCHEGQATNPTPDCIDCHP